MIKTIFVLIAMLVLLVTASFSFAFDVDLEKGYFKGKPLKTKIDYVVSLFGEPSEKGLYFNYINQFGLNLMIDTDTRFITKYSFYLVDWASSNPTMVPKMNKGFKGTFSYRIKAGALFYEVLAKIKTTKKKFMAFKGNWCFNYSGDCKDPGYLIIFEIDNQWYGEIIFDEKGQAFAIDLESQKSSLDNTESSSPYLQRINTMSIKEMLIVDHS